MSSTFATDTQLDEFGFKLIRDVLRSAGLRGIASDATSDMKRDASVFLTAEFRGGVRTKAGLADILNRRNRAMAAEAFIAPSSKRDATDRSRDRGGH